MTVDEQQVRDVARKAIGVLKEHGWQGRSGTYTDQRGCVCLLGAVAVVTDGDPYACFGGENRELHIEIEDRCLRVIYGVASTKSIAQWNDAARRTVKDVIDVLERVANGDGAP